MDCGVVGIINRKMSSFYTYQGLLTVQHRGEESSGIMTFNRSHRRYRIHKDAGTVSETFTNDVLEYLKGSVSIGHVRYPTSGKSSYDAMVSNSQPMYVEDPCLIGAVHNGQLTNYTKLKHELEDSGLHISSGNDLEPLLKYFAGRLRGRSDGDVFDDSAIVDAVRDTRDAAQGGYSVIAMLARGGEPKLVAFTSRKKIRLLVYGRQGRSWCIASESAVLDVLGYKGNMADVRFDEVLIADGNGKLNRHHTDGDGNAHCMFEWTYFSRPDSVIENRGVYDVRVRLGMIVGEKLRQRIDVKGCIIVPVPKSGLKYAEGVGRALGIHPTEALYKNEYVGRQFIRPKTMRKDVGNVKLNPIKGQMAGKRVVLADDSLVRGDTMRRNVRAVRQAGADEVHVVLGTPKFIKPCFYGIDMTTEDQFIANKHEDEEQIAKVIGADSVTYPVIDELVMAIGKPRNHICLGCLSGSYPTDVSALERASKGRTRPYEK